MLGDWNVAGISFCVLFFPLCGCIGWGLRTWAMRTDDPSRGLIEYGARCLVRWRQARATAQRESFAKLLNTPQGLLPHVHILDLDRSEITRTETGGVYAHCSMWGCDVRVYIKPNLAKVYIEEAQVAGAAR